MKRATWWLALTLVLAGAAGSVGCAKRAVETAPQPAATPAPAPAVVPAPSPAPQPEPAPQASVTSQDLRPAFFDYDSWTLRADARAALDANARLLRGQPAVRLTIEGHCDERGTVEYNQALGERRAAAARDYLVAAGVDAARIQVVSYGKEQPFSTGHGESDWAQNRRAHLVVD